MSSKARLGAFILGSLIIFTLLVFLVGEKQFIFSRTWRLKAPFENVAGLDEGAAVRAGGVRVGTVKEIQLPHNPGDKVIVEVELASSAREVIKKDSVATIETEGLLGSKYVALSFGSPQSEQARNGDTIQSQPPIDYGDIAKKASAMLDSAKEAVDSSKVAINNINQTTDDLKSISGKIDTGRGTIGALVNDKAAYKNLNATASSLRETADQAKDGVVSFQENMEALKHNFFLKGFFKKRGYYDSAELTKHAITKLPDREPLRKFSFSGNDLFGKPDSTKLKKEKSLDQIGAYLESNPYGLVIVATRTNPKGEKEANATLSQVRAVAVRQYLGQKLSIDDARIKTLGQGEGTQAEAGKGGSVEVIIYPDSVEKNVAKAKNK